MKKKMKMVARQKVAKKGLSRKHSNPRAIRFADGEESTIDKAVVVWQKNFPDENHSFNSFVRMSAVEKAKRTLGNVTKKMNLK